MPLSICFDKKTPARPPLHFPYIKYTMRARKNCYKIKRGKEPLEKYIILIFDLVF